MSLLKRVILFITAVFILIGFIIGGCYLMVVIGDIIPTLVKGFLP